MSNILDINTDDAVEPTIVPEGEYQVRITGFRKDSDGNIIRTSEKGNSYFIITFDIPSEPLSKGLSKIFSVPTEDMEPKRINAIKLDLKHFKDAFGLAEINFDSMVGKEGYALLSPKTSDDYGDQNEIKRWIAGA